MSRPRDRWLDQEAGPGRPALRDDQGPHRPAAGSTRPDRHGGRPRDQPELPDGCAARAREHRQILALCRRPARVVDLASDMDLPVGVVRVLLGDLASTGCVRVLATPAARPVTNNATAEGCA